MHVIKYKARKHVPESVPPALGCAFQSLRLHSENTKTVSWWRLLPRAPDSARHPQVCHFTWRWALDRRMRSKGLSPFLCPQKPWGYRGHIRTQGRPGLTLMQGFLRPHSVLWARNFHIKDSTQPWGIYLSPGMPLRSHPYQFLIPPSWELVLCLPSSGNPASPFSFLLAHQKIRLCGD